MVKNLEVCFGCFMMNWCIKISYFVKLDLQKLLGSMDSYMKKIWINIFYSTQVGEEPSCYS